MKLNAIVSLRVSNLFEEESLITTRTRSYTMANEGGLKKELNNMKPDIEAIIVNTSRCPPRPSPV